MSWGMAGIISGAVAAAWTWAVASAVRLAPAAVKKTLACLLMTH